jgi:hypothetical protein
VAVDADIFCDGRVGGERGAADGRDEFLGEHCC